MADEPKYEVRYCAYIDILGFSELIGQLRTDPARSETVRALLTKIRHPYDENLVGFGDTGFRAQSISDAVAVSTLPTSQGLSVLCAALREISLGLLYHGYFVRGAVCKGPLYHDDNMVFGEALIRAFRLESEIVKYPRIMLTKEVAEDGLASTYEESFPEHIQQAIDGPYFLHILWRLRMMLDVRREKQITVPDRDLAYYETMRERLQQRLDESIDNPRHFEKVQWFAKYWNVSLGETTPLMKKITGPGMNIVTWTND